MNKEREQADPRIATNRKAFRDFQVLDRLEVGIVLSGAEVKSIRAGGVSLAESYAQVDRGELWITGLHIPPYSHAGGFPVDSRDSRRLRKLLVHRRELSRLVGLTAEKGKTLVPLSMYFKRGRVKIELGICQGRHNVDRREDLKKKEADREARRAAAEWKKR